MRLRAKPYLRSVLLSSPAERRRGGRRPPTRSPGAKTTYASSIARAKKLWPTSSKARLASRPRNSVRSSPPPGCWSRKAVTSSALPSTTSTQASAAALAATRSGMARASAKNRRAGGVLASSGRRLSSSPAARASRRRIASHGSCASRQNAAGARHASPHRMSSRAVKNDAACHAKSCGSLSKCGKPSVGAARQPLSADAMRCSDARPNVARLASVVRLASLSWAPGDPFDDD